MALNPNSHIIAISGGKGGVGKSVFAANFAQALYFKIRKMFCSSTSTLKAVVIKTSSWACAP